MNPDDAISRLRAKASAVERAQRRAEKNELFARAISCNHRTHCTSASSVKSVEHVIADLSAKASMVEILSLTAEELDDKPLPAHRRSFSPTCRPHAPRRTPAFPKLHTVTPQTSPHSAVPQRSPPNPGRISLSSQRVNFSQQQGSSRFSPHLKSSFHKKEFNSQFESSSPQRYRNDHSASCQHDLNSPRQDTLKTTRQFVPPQQYEFTSPRHHESSHRHGHHGTSSPYQHEFASPLGHGRSSREPAGLSPGHKSVNKSTRSQFQHHPLCLQGHGHRYPCSCRCVSNVFQEGTPSSRQVTFSSTSPRYYAVAERGFEDMDLVALSPPYWRDELAPDMVEVSSQERVSPITIPSVIDDTPSADDDDEDSWCQKRNYTYRKREGKKRSSEHRRMTVMY